MADGWLDTPYSLAGKKIWVAGAQGMVGSAVVRHLQRSQDLLSPPLNILHNSNPSSFSKGKGGGGFFAEVKERGGVISGRKKAGGSFSGDYDFDLRDQAAVYAWMQESKPDVVVLAAAKVGGIKANEDAPATFLYDNLMIQNNIIHAAYETGVEKLLFLGSSCIYPRNAGQPITEDALLTGALEPTNEAYAVAKIAGVKMCESYRKQYGCDFISAMPCNLYGPGDKFDAQNSHVIPALMMKAHAAKVSGAKTLAVWGSGKPLREFLYVDDLAAALVFLLENYSGPQPVNIGSGAEVSIAALAVMIAKVVGFKGDLVFDAEKPDGTPRKLMDSGRINKAGWNSSVALEDGLQATYEWYLTQQGRARAA